MRCRDRGKSDKARGGSDNFKDGKVLAEYESVTMKTICTLAIEGSHGRSLFIQQDLYTLANKFWGQSNGGNGYFNFKTVSREASPVMTSSGLRILPDSALEDVAPGSLIVIPTTDYGDRRSYSSHLRSLTTEIQWLQRQHQRGAALTAHCTGSFILAETGLLNGLASTTSWWLLEAFKRLYPEVHLKRQNLIEYASDRLITGGSANADTLIALQVIEQEMGPCIADQCARKLLIDRSDNRRLPEISLQHHQKHENPLIAKAQSIIHTKFDQDISLTGLADQLGVSTRTLIRHFKDTLNVTPRRYLQKVRIETAASLLETTELGATEVMYQVGYEDPSNFSRVFSNLMGTTPAKYRRERRPSAEQYSSA